MPLGAGGGASSGAGGPSSFPPQSQGAASAPPSHSVVYGAPHSPAPSGSQVEATHGFTGSVPADRVAEAHKAARFAVSALAFDDVPAGVEYLKKALALLTNA